MYILRGAWDHSEVGAADSRVPPWPSCRPPAPRWWTRPPSWRSTCSSWPRSRTPTRVSCCDLFVLKKKIWLKLQLCSAWTMWWERDSLVQSEVLVCVRVRAYVSLCGYVCSCSKCTFWVNWMLKVKLIRSESTCWAQVIGCDKYNSFLSRTDLCQHSFLQSPADETKLKMMQEVSENFEVNAMNARSGWGSAIFFLYFIMMPI